MTSVWVFCKIIGSLFALAYGIYATVVDFYKKQNGQRHLSRKGKVGIGLLIASSSLAIFADYGEKKSAFERQRKEQQDQAAVTTEQLNRLGELAERLRSAQVTTTTISSDMQIALSQLNRNTKSVSKVLQQSERALEPLRDLMFNGALKVPESCPEVQAMITAVTEVIGRRPEAALRDGINQMWEGAGVPGFDNHFDLLRTAPKLTGYRVRKDSPLYPKPDSPLGAMAKALLIVLQFHNHFGDPARFTHNRLPSPNLTMEFVATPDDGPFNDIELTPDGSLVFHFVASVRYANWRSDGSILSVRDLLSAEVLVQPIFAAVGENDPKALDIWTRTTVSVLKVSTGDGRSFGFQERSRVNVAGVPAPLCLGRFVERERGGRL